MSGNAYREFVARVVKRLGYGGQYFAEQVLGWNRGTIRKGLKELDLESFTDKRESNTGRSPCKDSLPGLELAIRSIVEPSSQIDPTFSSTRLYTPLSARQVRQQLIRDFGFKDKELPARRTISTLLNQFGYTHKRVQKCKPLKRIPETDAIFDTLKPLNAAVDEDPGSLRISIDTKATVRIGPFSRGGTSRQPQKAVDHDFKPDTQLTPFGIFLPETNESWIWYTEGSVTSDFIADCLEELWPRLRAKYNPHTLVINADNGPECSGRRTQWLSRLVDFTDAEGVTVRLAYYPPYHSKYNPIERLWGILENHWRGEIIDSAEKALGLTRTMTYNKVKPFVRRVKKLYKKGVRLNRSQMTTIERRLRRKEGLENWFIDITPITQE